MRRMTLGEVAQELCWGLGFELLTKDALPLSFECRCSDVKAIDALAYFSPEERHAMIVEDGGAEDRKSTRLNSSHVAISYAVFCLKKKETRLHRKYHVRSK